jgi:hypothetical protein
MKKPNNTKKYAIENTGLKPDSSKATRKKRTIAKENKLNVRTKQA